MSKSKSVRVYADDYEKVSDVAEKESRSIIQQFRVIINEWLEQKNAPKKGAK